LVNADELNKALWVITAASKRKGGRFGAGSPDLQLDRNLPIEERMDKKIRRKWRQQQDSDTF
jgi:hypothetical protein